MSCGERASRVADAITCLSSVCSDNGIIHTRSLNHLWPLRTFTKAQLREANGDFAAILRLLGIDWRFHWEHIPERLHPYFEGKEP